MLHVGDPQLGSVVEDPDVIGGDHFGAALEPVDQRLRDSSGLE